ncbi:MAG: hypothetical protein ABIT38_16030, partial [Gemmatimonadaceae bacterium]
KVRQISAGYMHTCAIAGVGVATVGTLFCWGDNTQGQLGNGTTASHIEPSAVNGARSYGVVAAGQNHTCGIASSGSTYCWGQNLTGAGTSAIPTLLPGGLHFAELADGGWQFLCGRTLSKQVYCWGGFPDRALTTPTLMSGNILFDQIDVGTSHICGVTDLGALYCWGSLQSNQVGHLVTPVSTREPLLIPTNIPFTRVVAGGLSTCGLSATGAYCLGTTYLTGYDRPDPGPHPIPNENEHRFVTFSGAAFHTCAIDVNGGGWCWGRNVEGQLGSSNLLVPPSTPVQIFIR